MRYIYGRIVKRASSEVGCCYGGVSGLELNASGCSAARSARLPRVQEVLGSNPGSPTRILGKNSVYLR